MQYSEVWGSIQIISHSLSPPVPNNKEAEFDYIFYFIFLNEDWASVTFEKEGEEMVWWMGWGWVSFSLSPSRDFLCGFKGNKLLSRSPSSSSFFYSFCFIIFFNLGTFLVAARLPWTATLFYLYCHYSSLHFLYICFPLFFCFKSWNFPKASKESSRGALFNWILGFITEHQVPFLSLIPKEISFHFILYLVWCC